MKTSFLFHFLGFYLELAPLLAPLAALYMAIYFKSLCFLHFSCTHSLVKVSLNSFILSSSACWAFTSSSYLLIWSVSSVFFL
jgi:hypothetical protein